MLLCSSENTTSYFGVRKIAPKENYPPPSVRVWVWFRISIRIRAWGGNCQQQNFLLTTKHFCLRLLFFLILYTLFFYRTQDGSLLNLEIYKTKKYPLDYFLGKFWAFITVDRYHFGSGCDAVSSYIKKFFVNVRLTTMINLR